MTSNPLPEPITLICSDREEHAVHGVPQTCVRCHGRVWAGNAGQLLAEEQERKGAPTIYLCLTCALAAGVVPFAEPAPGSLEEAELYLHHRN